MTRRFSAEERQALFRSCARHLVGHGARNVKNELLALAETADAEQRPDVYGEGGAVAALEAEVAALFGKPSSVFMPSGTMAQQIALRIHAGRTGRNTVAFHPTCHLEVHEQSAYSRLHGLHARLVGRRDRLLALSDLELVAEPLAALLIELPQREIGGLLPSWEELVAQTRWARERGVTLHLDGARVWECAPFYGRSLAEIASLFDSVYVSFYKILGAIAGAALLGSEEFVREARVWQRRHGGNLVSMYPFALSARQGLEKRLGKMAQYRDDARRVAACLGGLPGTVIQPDPPQTNMFHAFLPVDAERLLDASAELATARGVALFTRTRVCDVPGHCSVEISIGDAARAISDAELGSWLRELWEHCLPENPAHTARSDT
jgi:threonine aldolase